MRASTTERVAKLALGIDHEELSQHRRQMGHGEVTHEFLDWLEGHLSEPHVQSHDVPAWAPPAGWLEEQNRLTQEMLAAERDQKVAAAAPAPSPPPAE